MNLGALKPDTPTFVAVAIVASFVAIIFVLFVAPVRLDQNLSTVLNMLLGALVAKFTTIVDFYFGSSTASKTKDETISRLTNDASVANANKRVEGQ